MKIHTQIYRNSRRFLTPIFINIYETKFIFAHIMKKIFTLAIVALFTITALTSCVTAEAATVAVETEYYDSDYNYVVVYIDGIANYRFWNDTYRRYYYYPVSRERFGYIRVIPHGHRPYMYPSRHHRHWRDVRYDAPVPGRHYSNLGGRPMRPRGHFGNDHGNIHHRRSSTYQTGRTSGGNTHHGRFGGRR